LKRAFFVINRLYFIEKYVIFISYNVLICNYNKNKGHQDEQSSDQRTRKRASPRRQSGFRQQENARWTRNTARRQHNASETGTGQKQVLIVFFKERKNGINLRTSDFRSTKTHQR
jgi:hypothetical protein